MHMVLNSLLVKCSNTIVYSIVDLQEKVTDKQNPDFAQPVPLDVLIQHKYIQPDINSLSCCLMVRISFTFYV